MVLSAATVIPYLLERRLLTPAQVLDEPLEVASFVSRNRGFRVSGGATRGWWVKQTKMWDVSNLAVFEQEAHCYWLARENPAFATLASLLPVCDAYDPESRVLVLELIRAEPVPVTAGSTQALARAMRQYQQGLSEATAREAGFRHRVPWALTLAEPDAARERDSNDGNRALLDILRAYPGFREALRALREEWQPGALLHGDMKLENCLIRDDRVWLLDWEIAAWGDPVWDAGGLLQSCWCRWINGSYSQSQVREASQAFWEIYGEGHPAGSLERTLRYAAARLIQTAWEWQRSSSRLRDDSLRMLQLSQNIFEHTAVAACELVGP